MIWWSILRLQILRRGYTFFIFHPVSSCRKGIVPMIYVYYDKMNLYDRDKDFFQIKCPMQISAGKKTRPCYRSRLFIPMQISLDSYRSQAMTCPPTMFFIFRLVSSTYNLTMILKIEKNWHIHESTKKSESQQRVHLFSDFFFKLQQMKSKGLVLKRLFFRNKTAKFWYSFRGTAFVVSPQGTQKTNPHLVQWEP